MWEWGGGLCCSSRDFLRLGFSENLGARDDGTHFRLTSVYAARLESRSFFVCMDVQLLLHRLFDVLDNHV